MTCEVAILNKYAVVIAADSAVTSTDLNGNEMYSKGGNKIFQLSHFEPIGVMIFGSAMLNGVPWELVIKAFRESLNGTRFGQLEEYASSFFEYVRGAQHFFSVENLQSYYGDSLVNVALKLLRSARSEIPGINDQAAPIADRAMLWERYLTDLTAKMREVPLPAQISEEQLRQSVETVPIVQPDTDRYLGDEGLLGVVQPRRWLEIACEYLFRNGPPSGGPTGMVFTGFGVDQHFPQLLSYTVPGFIANHFVYSTVDDKCGAIAPDVPSAIYQFAMTSSIDTFTTGIGVDAFSIVMNSYEEEVRSFATNLLQEAGVPIPADLDEKVLESKDAFGHRWVPEIYNLHYHPMKRVIATLPIEELVHLAETLIVLQSLKERVTSPKQSVGGPVDIAVLTKSEGLIWVKRKHFFDSEKNLRYVMRQKAIYN